MSEEKPKCPNCDDPPHQVVRELLERSEDPDFSPRLCGNCHGRIIEYREILIRLEKLVDHYGSEAEAAVRLKTGESAVEALLNLEISPDQDLIDSIESRYKD